MFLYIHDDEGDSCTIVDNTVISNELLHSFASKFICLGLNLRSGDGKKVMSLLNIESAPHITILSFNQRVPQPLGSRNGEDITLNGLIEMIDMSFHMEPPPSTSVYNMPQPGENRPMPGFPSLGEGGGD